ncbi:sensor histidine kinase [Blautia obeum]|nr:sensor histidine kinase [Blautia obeum]
MNITEAVRSHTGKEPERMNRLRKIFKNMKYRHKLTILLVVTSLAPMTVLALYSHSRQSTMVRSSELEDMQSIMEQTKEGIDSQTAVYASLLNYLTYSPDIEEIIKEKNIDNYTAYEKYTEIADPLLSVPKSYHDAINRIQLFADSIQVEHEYTLVPLDKMQEEWWSEGLKDDVRIQWKVDRTRGEVVAVRMIYAQQKLNAVLCISLDYDKIFQPLTNILTDENGGIVADQDGNVLYNKTGLKELKLFDDNKKDTSQTADKLLSKISQTCTWTQTESEENDWVFYFYKSQDAISGSVRRILLEEIPLIIACGFIILFLGLSFSRIFTRKIEELTKNMDQVNHGSREVTVSSDSEDEVGILINSFHNMMDEINRLIDEVYVNKIALKEYELKALQAQINPHFLYNTLSMMNWMAIRSNQMEISKVTLALSTFYRTALSKGEDVVTVENCIQNMQAYLEIQLTMHDNNFSVDWDIDPTIKNEKMPKLLLQPVVENAIEHGIDEKEDGDKKIFLSFRGNGDDVVITVRDNGMGMPQEKAETLVTYQAKGYGLKNVNDRIRILYGENYGIRIFSAPDEGTTVVMRFPKEDRKDEA